MVHKPKKKKKHGYCSEKHVFVVKLWLYKYTNMAINLPKKKGKYIFTINNNDNKTMGYFHEGWYTGNHVLCVQTEISCLRKSLCISSV